ncbi:MAG: S-layer homology domain-containing protein, partial [Vallitaleaceae bacterium]|nr:S-layer homology domain-containing protein [Vallitaleaceae bacterium]
MSKINKINQQKDEVWGRIKMKKTVTVIGLLTTIILVVGLASNSVQAASYTDVSDKDWFKADLSHISADSRDILKGYPDGTFKPAN